MLNSYESATENMASQKQTEINEFARNLIHTVSKSLKGTPIEDSIYDISKKLVETPDLLPRDYPSTLETLKRSEGELRRILKKPMKGDDPEDIQEQIIAVRSMRGLVVYNHYLNEAFATSGVKSVEDFKATLKGEGETIYSYLKKNAPSPEEHRESLEAVTLSMEQVSVSADAYNEAVIANDIETGESEGVTSIVETPEPSRVTKVIESVKAAIGKFVSSQVVQGSIPLAIAVGTVISVLISGSTDVKAFALEKARHDQLAAEVQNQLLYTLVKQGLQASPQVSKVDVPAPKTLDSVSSIVEHSGETVDVTFEMGVSPQQKLELLKASDYQESLNYFKKHPYEKKSKEGLVVLDAWVEIVDFSKVLTDAYPTLDPRLSEELSRDIAKAIYNKEAGYRGDPRGMGLMQVTPETQVTVVNLLEDEKLLEYANLLGIDTNGFYRGDKTINWGKKIKIRDTILDKMKKDPEGQILAGMLSLKYYSEEYGPFLGPFAYNRPASAAYLVRYFGNKEDANNALLQFYLTTIGNPQSGKYEVTDWSFDLNEKEGSSILPGFEINSLTARIHLMDKSKNEKRDLVVPGTGYIMKTELSTKQLENYLQANNYSPDTKADALTYPGSNNQTAVYNNVNTNLWLALHAAMNGK